MTGGRRLFLWGALLLALFINDALGQGTYQLANDGKTLIWNPEPQANEVAGWTGKRDKKRYATGPGTLTWYRVERKFGLGSRVSSKKETRFMSYSGNMAQGKFDGMVTASDADGNKTHAMFVSGARKGEWLAGPPTASESETSPPPAASPTPETKTAEAAPSPAASPTSTVARAKKEEPVKRTAAATPARPPDAVSSAAASLPRQSPSIAPAKESSPMAAAAASPAASKAATEQKPAATPKPNFDDAARQSSIAREMESVQRPIAASVPQTGSTPPTSTLNLSTPPPALQPAASPDLEKQVREEQARREAIVAEAINASRRAKGLPELTPTASPLPQMKTTNATPEPSLFLPPPASTATAAPILTPSPEQRVASASAGMSPTPRPALTPRPIVTDRDRQRIKQLAERNALRKKTNPAAGQPNDLLRSLRVPQPAFDGGMNLLAGSTTSGTATPPPAPPEAVSKPDPAPPSQEPVGAAAPPEERATSAPAATPPPESTPVKPQSSAAPLAKSSSPAVVGSGHLSAAEVIELGNAEARAQGYLLSDFEAPQAQYNSADDRWSVIYNQKSARGAAGTGKFFSVVIEDRTKKAEMKP